MNFKQDLNNQGYFIVKNIFSKGEIDEFRNEIVEYTNNNNTIQNAGGLTIPDFMRHKQLSKIAKIKDNKKILKILDEIFDNNYRFCSHNDIGINRIVGWHKDKLNGEYTRYETIDIWNEYKGEKHEIVKVLIYLQDHSKNNDGLKIVPKSHIVKDINTENWVQLNPEIGDVIIFDQRITHRGMKKQVKEPRILVSFGFGKNNIFTDNFEKGTIIRQNKQNKIN
jgi:hypothetical protein